MTTLRGPHFARGNRIDRLRARRTDDMEMMKGALTHSNEIYNRMQESSSAIKYAVGAMQPIDPAYTRNTYAEGDRVLNQLQKNLAAFSLACEFEYQGSVTSDTHIRARSDIDLLTLHCSFVTVESPRRPLTNPYYGDPVDDLMRLRRGSIAVLNEKFPEATIDATGSKSVTVSGGSLRRKVDVVASNWCDTAEFDSTGDKTLRAIQILDAHQQIRLRNLPFLHNARIEEKDLRTFGGLRKAIRLLKSLKYDSDNDVSISSYDIAAIGYSIDRSNLCVRRGNELQLVLACKQHLDNLAGNVFLRESLEVPNGTRRIFSSDGATLAGLNELRREVDQLVNDIQLDLVRSFRKLEAARVEY